MRGLAGQIPKRATLIVLVCAVSLAACGVIYHLWLRDRLNIESSGVRLKAGSESTLCGPKSLLIAIRRLGVPVEMDELLRDCDFFEDGTSFGELKSAARREGLRAFTRRLTWEKLVSLRTPAVLFVHGSHFVTADSRQIESEGHGGEPTVRIYDSDKPAKWWKRSELESIWFGESLVVERDTKAREATGPRVEWDTCWEDAGFLSSAEVARYAFHFRNTGDRPLTIDTIRASCGCATHILSKKRVMPGESGVLNVSVNLHTKRGGPFTESIYVSTNDPSAHLVRLILRGGVYSNYLTSVDKIYLGEVSQGQSLTKRFFVYDLYDPGEGDLKVLGVHARLSGAGRDDRRPKALVRYARVEAGSDLIGTIGRVPVREGDYAVGLSIDIPYKCPVGKFEGKVFVSTNLPGDREQLVVDINGVVVADVRATPRAVLLAVGEGRAANATITLKSLSCKRVEVATIKVDCTLPVKISRVSNSESNSVTLSIFCPAADFPESVINGNLVCEMNDGTILNVPIVIFSPDRKGGSSRSPN